MRFAKNKSPLMIIMFATVTPRKKTIGFLKIKAAIPPKTIPGKSKNTI